MSEFHSCGYCEIPIPSVLLVKSCDICHRFFHEDCLSAHLEYWIDDEKGHYELRND